MRVRSFGLGMSVFVLLCMVLMTPALAAASPRGDDPPPSIFRDAWIEVDRLVAEDKLEEASAQIEILLDQARAAGDEEMWTRSLLRAAQLRNALHKPEQAVLFLKDEPWPAGAVHRVALSLFYAQALETYSRLYAHEIRQRERVDSGGRTALDRWTGEQIADAARASCRQALSLREELGDVPVSAASFWLYPGDYPSHIRGTLRDAVSYFCLEIFDPSQSWPMARDDRPGLNLPDLIRGGGEAGAILADLEAWHLAAGRREAALEARLVWLRRLHTIFTEKEDRALIRRDLEERLPAFRDLPWWSMGMATLAEMYRNESSPGHLIRAHAAAVAGRDAYPGSPGGARCRVLAEEIEAPGLDLALRKSDGLGRRSIQVSHRNLAAVHFRAYAVDAERILTNPRNSKWLKDLVKTASPVASWQARLPETPDFEVHTTWVVPPIERPGAYAILASMREDFTGESNNLVLATLLLSDLVLVTRRGLPDYQVEALALSGATGEPLAGVRVRLFAEDGKTRTVRVEAEQTTGADGTCRFSAPPNTILSLLAEQESEVALAENVWNPDARSEKGVSAFVYTDRALYRPLQTIRWKVLAYRGRWEAARFGALAGETVTVRLRDANHKVVAERTATTSKFGTASGDFQIPGGRLLGDWTLEARDGKSNLGQASVKVEEYKRPTFEVSLQDSPEPLRLGRPAKLSGKAVYYFGLPVARGEVRWRVTRTPNLSWDWYRRHDWRGYPQPQAVASGTSALSADGTFEIAFTPEPVAHDAHDGGELTYSFAVSAEVTDAGGETRSAERPFFAGSAEVAAVLWIERGFLMAGTPATVEALRRDLNGAPRPGTGAWTLRELIQPDRTLLPGEEPEEEQEHGLFLTPGDRLRSRWSDPLPVERAMAAWKEGRQVAGGPLRHGPDGKAEIPLPPLKPGVYRLLYETVDGAGVRVEARRDLLVAGPRTSLALPAVLKVENRTVSVGGTARLLVHSGLPDQTFFFEVWRGGERLERRILKSGEAPSLVEIPIRRRHRGGLAFRLLLLRDHQLFDLEETVRVPWDDRELKVSFATVRDTLRPGARETWRVTVRPPQGAFPEAAAAEVLALMTDRSLDVFGPHALPDPLRVLYPDSTVSPPSSASLGMASLIWLMRSWRQTGVADLRKPSLRYLDGFGLGGPGRRTRAYFGDLMIVEGVVVQTVTAIAESPLLDERRISTGMAEARILNSNSGYYDFDSFEEMQAPAARPTAVRSDFSETAFWEPHLLTGADGTATIEFTVPGSVTSWNVWVQAVTRDLRAGTLKKEVRSVRDLLARPYLPRFLRQGDRAEIRVVLTSAAKAPLSGEVTLEIFDPETGESRLADFGLQPGTARLPFTVAAGGGASVAFPVTAPKGLGDVAFRVLATAGDESDGELRPLPLLPSRVHLIQSRFAALRGPGRKVLRFEDLEESADSTRIDERMVVTLDAQLFQGVLAALPYLANYPYECTEQTLNRFLSTGILASLFDRYPAVARLAEDFAKRETPQEAWGGADPNRLMSLEETPFLQSSQGGDGGKDFIRVLDPRIARADRDTALAKLAQAQRPDGAFPWWPGGPASPYMTAYLLHGFARAAEFGIDVPRDMVGKGWEYLASYYREEHQKRLAESCCLDILVLMNYIATVYPDPSWMGSALKEEERREILDTSFRHWHDLSPYLRSLLALTLKRMGRPADAQLVFDSVLDSARTTPEEGTFWQPEERSWLWYNDTIESHAFALRTLMELRPDDPRRHGLVQWLFLNKQLNHWKSTRATAEVVYALVHYLQREGQLGVTETATVQAGGRTTAFTFEPDRYTGKDNRIVIPGDEIDPVRSEVVVEKDSPGFLFASATWHFSTDTPPEAGSGGLFQVSRRYFLWLSQGDEAVLRPLDEGTVLKPGDEVEIQLTLSSRAPAEYVHLRDPRPAGLEPGIARSGWRWDLGLARYEETRDSGTSFFFERLPAGEHTLRYRLRANLAGTFRAGPATVQSMYAPEFTAYSAGAVVRVESPGQ